MRHRELVVVGVQPEQRQVGVQHLRVDAVEVHVLEDVLGVALRRAPARLAVPRDRPALETGRVEAAEDAGAVLDERLDLEVLFPHRTVAEVLREAGLEEVDRFEQVPVPGDDEVRVRHRCAPPPHRKRGSHRG
jgi:hypothetical protein